MQKFFDKIWNTTEDTEDEDSSSELLSERTEDKGYVWVVNENQLEHTKSLPKLPREDESMRYSLDANEEDRVLFMSTFQEALHSDRFRNNSKVARAFDFNKNFKDVGDIHPDFGASSPHIFGTPPFGSIPGGRWIFIPKDPAHYDDGSADLLRSKTGQHSHEAVDRPPSPDSTGHTYSTSSQAKKFNPWGLITDEDIKKGIAPDTSKEHMVVPSIDAFGERTGHGNFEIPFFSLEEPPESPEAEDYWDESVYSDIGKERNPSERSIDDSGPSNKRTNPNKGRIKEERKSLLFDYSTTWLQSNQHQNNKDNIDDDDVSQYTVVTVDKPEDIKENMKADSDIFPDGSSQLSTTQGKKEQKAGPTQLMQNRIDLLLEQSSTFSETSLKERAEAGNLPEWLSQLSASPGKKGVHFIGAKETEEPESENQHDKRKRKLRRQPEKPDDLSTPLAGVVVNKIMELDRQLQHAYAQLEESEVEKRKLIQQLSFLRMLEMEAGELEALNRILDSTIPDEKDVEILDKVIDRMRYRKPTQRSQ